MSHTLDALTCLALAAMLVTLGVWGRSQAHDLVLPTVEGEERERRIAVLRRGSATCVLAGAGFAVIGLWLLAKL